MLINLDRARRIMEKYGLDALIATHPHNVFYVSNFPKHPVCASPLTPCLCDIPAYAILPLEKNIEPAVIVPMIQLGCMLGADSWIKDFRYYGTFFTYESKDLDLKKLSPLEKAVVEVYRSVKLGKELIEVLKETLDDKGLSKGRLGLDEEGLTPRIFQRVKEALPNAEIVDGTDVFYEIRLVKGPEEIDRMRKAADINLKALKAVWDAVKVGVTEVELWEVTKGGGFSVHPSLSGVTAGREFSAIVISGLNPTKRPLERGDIIRMDCDLIYKDYFSDVARSGVIGKPSEKVKRYFDAIIAGHDKAEEAMKPGAKPSEIFRIAVDTIKRSGISWYDRPVCGHGIGIECYNPLMSIGPKCNTILEPGMTINLETPYYEIGLGGFNLENTVLVTKRGNEVISKYSKELIIW